MKTEYLNGLAALLLRARPRLGSTHDLRFRSCFGAVAGYVDGNIFISHGRFGTALKLPSRTINRLLEERGVRHLKYFPNGHVKKEYVVLPKRILDDHDRLKKLVDQSIRFVRRRKTAK